ELTGGGLLFQTGSTGDFEDVDVTDNVAVGGGSDGRGGGVRINANNGEVTVVWNGGTISGNQTTGTPAESGGAGIHVQGNPTGDGGTLEMTGVTISNNTAASDGGG